MSEDKEGEAPGFAVAALNSARAAGYDEAIEHALAAFDEAAVGTPLAVYVRAKIEALVRPPAPLPIAWLAETRSGARVRVDRIGNAECYAVDVLRGQRFASLEDALRAAYGVR